jgi:hypothetical protein
LRKQSLKARRRAQITNAKVSSVALRASFFAKATKDKLEDTANAKKI